MPFNSSQNTLSIQRVNTAHYRSDPEYMNVDLRTLNIHTMKYEEPKNVVKTEIVPLVDYEDDMVGGSKVGKFFKKAGRSIQHGAYKLDRDTRGAQKQVVKAGNSVGHSTTDKNGLVRHLIQSTNDVVLPVAGTVAGTAIGAYVGGPAGAVVGAKVGNMTGQIVRKTIAKQTGYGKPVSMKDIINKYVPNYQEDVKSVPVTHTKVTSARNLLIKKLMAENPGMTLPQASKYIKDNGLY